MKRCSVCGKSFGIGTKLREANWATIAAEIEKCEVVCANCHRRRTARRGGFLRAIATEKPCIQAHRDDAPRLLWTTLRSSMRE